MARRPRTPAATPAAGLVMPPRWQDAQIAADATLAVGHFRQRREAELTASDSPYAQAFAALHQSAQTVIPALDALPSSNAPGQTLAAWLEDPDCAAILRSLPGPPISEDDLATLLDASISPARLRRDEVLATALAGLIARALDKYRFAWFGSGREASPTELHVATVSTAVLAAAARAQTQRRSDERDQLEESVAAALEAIGWTVAARAARSLRTTRDWPGPSTFMRHVTLGEHNADFVIRLADGRIVALECKASNSVLNSRKRLNKEAERDARHWIELFGTQVVPAVALRGVFDPRLVAQAQGAGLAIVWGHRLGDLTDFVGRAR